jgi:hypothetical protein
MFYQFLAYLFVCLGVTYAWSDTEIARPFRNFIAKIPYIHKPLLCHECSSFWISLAISFFINPFDLLTYTYFSNLFSAFCGFFINLYFVRNQLVKYKDY